MQQDKRTKSTKWRVEQMKNRILKVLSLVMIFALVLSQVAYAKPEGVGRGREHAPGQLKKMEGYMNFAESKIRVRNMWIESEQPPVLKQNRTLIPVRAITEALGCEVLWFNPYAVIISPDEDMVIIFDLETDIDSDDGKTYMFDDEDEDFDDLLALVKEFDPDEADDFYEDLEAMMSDGQLVAIDVSPGLINNRTYVPIRFIAEAFGLRVSYNEDTKEIDIDDETGLPELDPDKEEIQKPEDVVVVVTLNDHAFKGIKLGDDMLVEDVDYTSTTGSSLTVTLLKDFIEELDSEEHVFEFVFENQEDEEVTIEFELTLEYLDQLPKLSQERIRFNERAFEDSDYADAYGNLVVELELNSWEFKNISSLDEDEEYETSNDGDEVSITENYLNDLDEGDYELQFVFELDDLMYVNYLEIEVN